MSAAVVEVKDDDTFAYYSAYIKDFDKGHVLVHFDNGWKPDEWVPPAKVRQAVPPHDPTTFVPKMGDDVEAMAKSHEDEPFSWWRAKVKTIRGDFYLINYSDWDDTYNEIVEKELLRPPNPNVHLDQQRLVKKQLSIPPALRESDQEKADQKLQQEKQKTYADIQQNTGLLSLIEDPTRNVLLLIGTGKAVDQATAISKMHFKHRAQIKQLQQQTQQEKKALEEHRRVVKNSFVEEFEVRTELVGLVIGKSGSNVRKAEKLPDVLSVRVLSERGIVRITAKTKAAALEARRLLEFVEETFPVPASSVGRVVGPKFSHIKDIEKNSGVQRIRVPTREERLTASRKAGRGGWGDEDTEEVDIHIIGTTETVQAAVMLLKQHMTFVEEMKRAQSEQDRVRGELSELSDQYGVSGGGRGRGRGRRGRGGGRGGRGGRGGAGRGRGGGGGGGGRSPVHRADNADEKHVASPQNGTSGNASGSAASPDSKPARRRNRRKRRGGAASPDRSTRAQPASNGASNGSGDGGGGGDGGGSKADAPAPAPAPAAPAGDI